MAADDTTESGGVFDTRKDAGEGEAGLVKLWLEALDLSSRNEEDWRKSAQACIDTYRDSKHNERKEKAFNILYSNTETLAPALYNSVPIPDVRPRYMSGNPLDKQVSQVIERALSFSVDTYDFDGTMRAAVKDRLLPGRAVTRVRYEPKFDAENNVVYEAVTCEPVDWADFRIGPARIWSKTPWIAYRHYLTREQVIGLNEKIGATIPLDSRVDGKTDKDEDDNRAPDVFKRLMVWEIWDKEAREILFIAPSYKQAPLKREQDMLKLEGFFDVPRPMLAVETPDTQTPIEPYRLYKDQAEELDIITRRITALTRVLKSRGVYASDMSDAFSQLKDAKDGEYVPSDNVQAFLQGGLDNAIWQWPIETIIAVIKELYLAREQIKAIIFEITGVADVMRGQTDAGETLGAQQLKSQWGSLRLQSQQGDVQRYVRDLFRIKAEIIATKFSAQTLSTMTGVQVTPEMEQILRSDIVRSYRIDIETDSTIQADVQRAQQQAGQFIQGAGTFFQAIGPAVQAGAMPPDVAIKLFMGLARPFKLGKQAEDALDAWEQQTTQKMEEQKANPQPPPPDPEQIKVQAEMQRAQAEMQAKQAELQQSGAIEGQRLQLEAQDRAAKTQIEQQRIQLEGQFKGAELELRARELGIKERELALKERDLETRAALESAKIADGREARAEQAINGAQEREFQAQQKAHEKAEEKEPKESAPQVIVVPLPTGGNRRVKVERGPDGRMTGASLEEG